MKELPFPFMSVTRLIWMVIDHPKYFTVQSVVKFFLFQDNKRPDQYGNPNLMLIQLKKQGSECSHNVSLLKKIFRKHSKYAL